MNGLLTELREGLEADGIPVVPRALSDHRANLGEGLLYLGDGWHVEVLPDYTQLQEARHTLEHGTFAEQREVADRILEGRL